MFFPRYLNKEALKDQGGGAKVMQTGQLAMPKMGQAGDFEAPSRVNGWMARMFGCWHRELSRPFSHQGKAYRVCLNCGAQRRFDLRNWTMSGNFYYGQPTHTV